MRSDINFIKRVSHFKKLIRNNVADKFIFYRTKQDDKRIKLFGSKVLRNTGNEELIPGQIEYADSLFKIGTATEPIQITNIQIEGKKMLPVEQFILGIPRITGEHFD